MDDSDSDSSVEGHLNKDCSFLKSRLFEEMGCTSSDLSVSTEACIENVQEENVVVEDVEEAENGDVASPSSRYENLILGGLSSIAQRIKAYHQQVNGVVSPEEVVPRQPRRKRVGNKRTQTVLGNKRRQTNARRRNNRYRPSYVEPSCSAFGITHCLCCYQEPFLAVDEQDVSVIDDSSIDHRSHSCNEAEEQSEIEPQSTHASYISEMPSPSRISNAHLATSTPRVTTSSQQLGKILPSRSVIDVDSLGVENRLQYLVGNCSAQSEEREESVNIQEEQIMDLVNDVLGSTAEIISEEVEERFQRLCENRRAASDAISNAVINHDALHEEMDLDQSVILVSVTSPQSIAVRDSPNQIDEGGTVDNGDYSCVVVEDTVSSMVGQTRKRTGSTLRSRKKKKCPNAIEQKNVEGAPEVVGTRLHECPICLEPLSNAEISATICGHVFCTECIKTAIKTTKMCPNCRTKLTLKKIHPLYF